MSKTFPIFEALIDFSCTFLLSAYSLQVGINILNETCQLDGTQTVLYAALNLHILSKLIEYFKTTK